MLTLGGCASKGSYKLNIMPSPTIVDESIYNELIKPEEIESAPFEGVPFITDRLPLDQSARKGKGRYYGNDRSPLLRVGFGKISYRGKTDISAEEIDSPTTNRQKSKIPIEVSEIEELGLLADPLPYGFLTDRSLFGEDPPADNTFADLINKKLSTSGQKDIFLYVHGFKVVFANPLLVAAEFWHFMGYKGAFIAYTWPSTPRGLAYFKDAETAQLSGQNLRLALEYLAKYTNAERIHIIGYSAGTRVVITALHQLALISHNESDNSVRKKYRIGQVALIGSDYDANQFGIAVANGLTRIPQNLSIYMSRYDEALGVSNFVFGQKRLGQYVQDAVVPPSVHAWLKESNNISFIDVSNAKKSHTGKGHGYFRKSPWVSSDLLLTLARGLTPEERGLEKSENGLTWAFPKDYIERMLNNLSQNNIQ